METNGKASKKAIESLEYGRGLISYGRLLVSIIGIYKMRNVSTFFNKREGWKWTWRNPHVSVKLERL